MLLLSAQGHPGTKEYPGTGDQGRGLRQRHIRGRRKTRKRGSQKFKKVGLPFFSNVVAGEVVIQVVSLPGRTVVTFYSHLIQLRFDFFHPSHDSSPEGKRFIILEHHSLSF